MTISGQEVTEDAGRQRSSIGFPYADLDDGLSIANAIYNHVGGGDCTSDQLAPWVGMSPKSSGFRTRVYAAKMFGLVDGDGSGPFELTPLGKRSVDLRQKEQALVDAFFMVPLFSKVFEDHKGVTLPPTQGLESYIGDVGVAPKQVSRARQVLERSAETAGFFKSGRDRLVKPGVSEVNTTSTLTNNSSEARSGGEYQREKLPPLEGYDPMVIGLFRKLPKSGKWSSAERRVWFAAANSIFDLVYGEDKNNDQAERKSVRQNYSQDIEDEIPF